MTHEEKLDKLRQEWKTVNGTNRKIIEQRARLIQWAMEKRDTDETVENVKQTLL